MRTKFYLNKVRADKLIEDGEEKKYGEDTIIVPCEEIPMGVGYLVKGQEILTVILDYNEEEF